MDLVTEEAGVSGEWWGERDDRAGRGHHFVSEPAGGGSEGPSLAEACLGKAHAFLDSAVICPSTASGLPACGGFGRATIPACLGRAP